jgi:alkylation response protein AidB-like acyl-CoA dehydrogenase
MDLSFSPEEEAFRQEVRDFIAEAKPKLPPDLGPPEEARLSKDDYLVWHRLLFEKGWVAPDWPKDLGGCAWSVTRKYIFATKRPKPGCRPPCPSGWAWWAR